MMSRKNNKKHYIILLNIFIVISFLGYILEISSFYLVYKIIPDRGFLNLPFCPIYGFAAILVYSLIGLPQKNKYTGKSSFLWVITYFAICMILPTLIELAVGLFYEEQYQVILWDYTEYPYSYRRYVCLGFSLIWGVLLTLGMGTLFPLLYKVLNHFPYVLLLVLGGFASIIMLWDFLTLML